MLTLHTCGHSFHAKCLTPWFLLSRYDCPICRKPYYWEQRRGLNPQRIAQDAGTASPDRGHEEEEATGLQ